MRVMSQPTFIGIRYLVEFNGTFPATSSLHPTFRSASQLTPSISSVLAPPTRKYASLHRYPPIAYYLPASFDYRSSTIRLFLRWRHSFYQGSLSRHESFRFYLRARRSTPLHNTSTIQTGLSSSTTPIHSAPCNWWWKRILQIESHRSKTTSQTLRSVLWHSLSVSLLLLSSAFFRT